MKTIDLNGLKRIQLDILSYLDKFCQENGINYSVSGGTAIGAIRHEGFIPWDDDIDLMMKREDYEKFINTFNDPTGVYKVHCLENDENYSLPFAKIEDSRTLLYENSTTETLGINIDIFPSDYLGDTIEESEDVVDEISKDRFKLKVKLVRPGKKNSFIKKLGILIFKALYLAVGKRNIAEKIQDRAISYSNQGKKMYCGCVVWGYGKKEIIPSYVFNEFIRVNFEDRQFSIVKGYDTYLTSVYGDYMQLPPIEKRQSPHTLNNVFWKDGFPKK